MVHDIDDISHDTPKDSELQCRVAEFNALRQEIERRSQIQLNLFVLQLTASGAIFSFALARSGGSPFLLIIPISTFMLCAEYVDQIYGQRIVGHYIMEKLAVPGELQWESWLQQNYRPDISISGAFFQLFATLVTNFYVFRGECNKKRRHRQRRIEAAQFSQVRRFCASIVTFPLIAAAALVWAGWDVVWSVPRPAGYVWYLMAWMFDVAFTFFAAVMIWRVRP
jgi:hypothetical protein